MAWASASQPLRAMTVTAARSVSDIAPEAGSRTWWRTAPSWTQRRERVLDVATPPALTVNVMRSAPGSSGSLDRHRPAAGQRCRPGAGEVAADVDERTAGTDCEQLGDDEVGGQSLADAARVQGDAGRCRHGPPFGIDGDGGEAPDVAGGRRQDRHP